ncbi:ATP-binding protein [Candidatus Saccharibacteria bacterium]|nr:ATP-binding protein [Candidatus Saccharibacteria bacterium]
MIQRSIESKIKEKLGTGKAIIIFGARQVGKTTLLKHIFKDDDTVLWLNGDEKETRIKFENISSATVPAIIGDHKTIILDEAQRIKDIGLKLKIIQDNFGKDIQLIATGSSSFDLANEINEPMTGRKWTFWLPPITITELVSKNGTISEQSNLHNRLLYGSYPDVINDPKNAEEIVLGLAGDDLYKDVLNLGEIIKTDKLSLILQALAFQIGSQVSMNELASLVGVDSKTIDKYIALLEQSFIIFRLPSYSHNLRNELKSSNKFYFYDCGIRNALIEDFRPLSIRQDIGNLFENYIISEFKKQANHKSYFWRTTQQQEIDYIAIKNTLISAAEIKWNENKTIKFPKSFTESYHPNELLPINSTNYLNYFTTNKPYFLS